MRSMADGVLDAFDGGQGFRYSLERFDGTADP
jgi:hypothetical protein